MKQGSFKDSEPYYLNNISARCPVKGHKGQPIHLDSNLAGVNYNIIVNVMYDEISAPKSTISHT